MPGWGSPHDPPIAAPRSGREPRAARHRPGPIPAASRAVHRLCAGPVDAVTRRSCPPTPACLPQDGPSAIRIEALTRRYPGVLALDALTLDVPEGSVFGLLGPNGAGKTTTLRLLAGLGRPTAGRAVVAGVPVSADDPSPSGASLGFLEQDPRAYGWMTGREQVRLLGRLHGMEGAALERAVAEALATGGPRRGRRPPGRDVLRRHAPAARDRRRARPSPPVLILDEPVSALDPEGRRDVLGLIAGLRGESTVLFSTHVLADVERICDRVGILDHGRLVVEGPLGELLDRYALPVWRIEAEPGQDCGDSGAGRAAPRACRGSRPSPSSTGC